MEPRGAASTTGHSREGSPGSEPAGFRILIPGYAHWAWRQRERAFALGGTFAAATLTSAFAWGTWPGALLLVTAFATHVYASADALRQNSFPALGLRPALLGTAGGLAALFYGPLLAAASVSAWPGFESGYGRDGYLVDLRAYRKAEPRENDWVWYRPAPDAEPRLGRVVAGRGQDVVWSDETLRVDGLARAVESPFRAVRTPSEMAYRVPDGHILIDPRLDPQGLRLADALAIVPREQVMGRAWAQVYPITQRRMLH